MPGPASVIAHRSFRDTAQLNNAFGNHIHVRFYLLSNLIEQFMQTNKVRSFHVPMRLLELHLEINGVGQALVHQRVQFLAGIFRKIIFSFEHFGGFHERVR